jgi:hypothetical protein
LTVVAGLDVLVELDLGHSFGQLIISDFSFSVLIGSASLCSLIFSNLYLKGGSGRTGKFILPCVAGRILKKFPVNSTVVATNH